MTPRGQALKPQTHVRGTGVTSEIPFLSDGRIGIVDAFKFLLGKRNELGPKMGYFIWMVLEGKLTIGLFNFFYVHRRR